MSADNKERGKDRVNFTLVFRGVDPLPNGSRRNQVVSSPSEGASAKLGSETRNKQQKEVRMTYIGIDISKNFNASAVIVKGKSRVGAITFV